MIRVLICVASLTTLALAQPNSPPQGGLSLWPSDSLTKVMRSASPTATTSQQTLMLEFAGAKGEIVSGQAVCRSGRDIESVSPSLAGLQGKGGAILPGSTVHLQWVRYIDINRNSKLPADELVAKAPGSIPDPYWEQPVLSLKANQAQPLWIEIRIPRQAVAGDYEGRLTITGSGLSAVLPLRLHVWDFEMPQERHLSVVNWWAFPGVGFADRIKSYSPEYWQLLAKCCAFLVEHRQTDINTSIDLIRESGSKEKGYSHDTSVLEQYAEVAFGAGIRQIQLHSVGRRVKTHTDPGSRIEPIESGFRKLAALEKVIQRRQWQRRFAVSISDEPFIYQESTYAAVVDRIHQTAPSVRVIEAVETEYLGKLDIYVPKLSHLNLWYPHFDRVRREGAELWFYTCCHPLGRYPNRFLDQPLVKARVLHWINYLYDMDGYLHWGLNHFAGSDPYCQEGISKDLPLGDRAIAYPGTQGLLGSLRFSALRDGLQDFEYLWVLEDRLGKVKQKVGNDAFWLDPRQRPLELCRRVVQSFHAHTRDGKVLLNTRSAIAEEIEALQSDPLVIVQTSPPEGTVVPAGPRVVNVRGLIPPGAKARINGKDIQGVRPNGTFVVPHFMEISAPVIRIEVEHNGARRTVSRTFIPTD